MLKAISRYSHLRGVKLQRVRQDDGPTDGARQAEPARGEQKQFAALGSNMMNLIISAEIYIKQTLC